VVSGVTFSAQSPVTVTISPTSMTMAPGGTPSFTASVSAGVNPAVTRTASAGTITGTGNTITFTAPNTSPTTVTVTATSVADTSKSASATVNVSSQGGVTVAVPPPTADLVAGATATFTATVSGATNTAVSWTATGGTVSGNGNTITYTAPVTPGSFTLTATSVADTSKSASSVITVLPPVTVSIAPQTLSMAVNEQRTFSASVIGTTNTAVTWSATAGSVSANDPTIIFTAPSTPGTVALTATSVADPSKSATATITVSPVASLTVNFKTLTLVAGAEQTLVATVVGLDPLVNWSTTGGTITGTGTVVRFTAPSVPGNYTVLATSALNPSVSASVAVTVVAPVIVSINPSVATAVTGGSQSFTAIVTGASNTAVTWTASSGTITGTGNTIIYGAPTTPGTYTVTATSVADPAQSATAVVTVSDVQVFVSPPSASLAVNQTQSLTAIVSGTLLNEVTWSVSGGTITGTGNVVTYTAPAVPGSYTATATSVADPTKSATAAIDVTAVDVAVSPPTATIKAGTTVNFTATVTGGNDHGVEWSTDNGTLVVISTSSAKIGAQPTGTSTVTYTAPTTAGTTTVTAKPNADKTKKAVASITVTPIVTLSVTPATASVITNASQAVTATVSGTTTTGVTWSTTCGTIVGTANTITFNAPGAPTTCTVTATSVADPSV